MAEYVKISKTAAQYEHPAKKSDHCSMCKFFERVAPLQCLRVEGKILPIDWCKLFQPKSRFGASKS